MNTINKRYNRQTILPEIGEEGQEKLQNASILCVGAGGLGCPALLYLTAAGIGHIGIIDFDVVDESNLQRQVLFSVEQVGRNKATAAKQRLKALNPAIKITAYEEELSDKNAEKLFNKYNIIIDGTDNFSSKFLINDAAVKYNKPFIYASILGFDGQVSTFNVNNSSCYRCLFPAPPTSHIPNCAEAGIIGAVAGIIGTTQAMEAIKLIVNHESFKPLIGKLWTLDLHSMENKVLSLPKDSSCPVCSINKEDITLEHSPRKSAAITKISPEDAQKRTNALLIDVREQNEWDAGHVKGAQHIALSKLQAGYQPDIPKDQEVILYCLKGMRCLQAAEILEKSGHSNLHNVIGGYHDWPKEEETTHKGK